MLNIVYRCTYVDVLWMLTVLVVVEPVLLTACWCFLIDQVLWLRQQPSFDVLDSAMSGEIVKGNIVIAT